MVKDIIYDGDLLIENGDFVVAVSDEQHFADILLARPGDYKSAPWMGTSLEDYRNAPVTGLTRQQLERDIKLNFEADGAKNVTITIPNDFEKIEITGGYE